MHGVKVVIGAGIMAFSFLFMIPFMIFGSYYWCYSEPQGLRPAYNMCPSIDTSFLVFLLATPFFGIGIWILGFGIKDISIRTFAKRQSNIDA